MCGGNEKDRKREGQEKGGTGKEKCGCAKGAGAENGTRRKEKGEGAKTTHLAAPKSSNDLLYIATASKWSFLTSKYLTRSCSSRAHHSLISLHVAKEASRQN